MSSLTESTQLESNHNRWRYNTQGQLVDSEAASAGWDLADEIVRLKIADVVGEGTVAPLTDSSPLETASSITSSPNQISVSHSRESSADISASSSQESAAEHVLHSPFKGGNVVEVKERPHSFSGGLSSADLRRLQQAGGPEVTDQLQQQQQQWAAAHNVSSDGIEQPSYPSLANTIHRPHPQQVQLHDYRAPGQQPANSPSRDDLMQQIDYSIQQRTLMSPATATSQGVPFAQGRTGNIPSPLYRQPPRAFPQQNVIPSPTSMAYPAAPHLPLGNSQQLYDMMLPPHESMNPAVNRVQQQHNVFRGAHHHSTSDPSALRDAATMALLNGNMQFNPAMFPAGLAGPPPGMPIYPNQYYRAQDAYRPDAAQAMAARLQAQYTGPYGMVAPPIDPAMASPTNSSSGQNGPSANNRKLGLYKTELCRSWEEKGSCRYGAKCQFAHGEEELRNVSRHPKYKTEICRTFWVSGSCPYGKRCCFIHTELPTSGNAAGASTSGSDTAPPPAHTDGRARSMSTNSDPNDASVSLLARISAKRSQESSTNSSSTPVDSPSSFQFTRPPTGTLRVDTSTLDASLKQNKSAYPTFARNGVLLPAPEDIKAKSPAPVTAGPDLGSRSRLEIVGYNQRVNTKTTTPPSTNSRNSIGGADEMNFSPSPVSGGHSYTLSSGDGTGNTSQTRVNGHVRAGSAGNWASITRNNTLASTSFPSPGGDTINSPWSTTELAVGTSRFPDKAWA